MKNIFEQIPSSLEEELFDVIAESDNVKIERIVSRGQRSPKSGWYDQAQHEWVIVLRGEALIVFENQNTVRLKEGDFINIAAHEKHRVEWTDPERNTVWLAVFYD